MHAVIIIRSSLPERLDSEDQVRHHQLLLSFIHSLFFLGQRLESLIEERVIPSREDVILPLHLLVLRYFVALDGQHLEHLHLFVRTPEVLDETLEALQLLQTQQGVQNLLVDKILARS